MCIEVKKGCRIKLLYSRRTVIETCSLRKRVGIFSADILARNAPPWLRKEAFIEKVIAPHPRLPFKLQTKYKSTREVPLAMLVKRYGSEEDQNGSFLIPTSSLSASDRHFLLRV